MIAEHSNDYLMSGLETQLKVLVSVAALLSTFFLATSVEFVRIYVDASLQLALGIVASILWLYCGTLVMRIHRLQTREDTK